MRVLRWDGKEWVPADPMPYKGFYIYRAGWPADKALIKVYKWHVWIGPYKIGWAIP